MKKALSVILAIMLFAVCFTACSESPAETKTDAKPVENANSVVVSQAEGSADDTVQPTPEASQPQQNSAPAQQQEQTNEPSLPTQQPASTPNQPTTTVTPEEIHGDIAREYPTFVSEQALQTWLKQGSGQYEKERTDILQQANSQKFIYLRPACDLSQYGELTRIKANAVNQEISYYYQVNNSASIEIFSYWTNSAEDLYLFFKDHAEKKGGIYSIEANDIQYYYVKGGAFSSVVWQQYGFTHSAFVHQNRDKIEEIIPLLKLEQVTVNLNSDHVTE